MQIAAEHEFGNLRDKQLDYIWALLQNDIKFKGKDLHQLSLATTFPLDAGRPVSLDELIGIVTNTSPTFDQLQVLIIDLVNRYDKQISKVIVDRNDGPNLNEHMVRSLAEGLLRLHNYRVSFQLISFSSDDDDNDDDYLLYERIGRGGVQITQRQSQSRK